MVGIGISDRARRFHLVAMVILSQITEPTYTKALAALRRLYTAVTSKQLAVTHVMGDADDGQYNVVECILGEDNQYVYLMCYFHVLKKVLERTKSIEGRRANSTVYGLHFSRSQYKFLTKWNHALPQWNCHQDTQSFAAYFNSVWPSGKFYRWQCFQTPSEYATTNNPPEQFNSLLKSDYSLRARLKMGVLPQQLLNNEGAKTRVFSEGLAATDPLKCRARDMSKRGLLLENVCASGKDQDPYAYQSRVVNVLS